MTAEDPKQQLHDLIKNIVQQLNENPSDELRQVFNQFMDDMPEQERLIFMEEVLAVNGWQKLDKSQWPKTSELNLIQPQQETKTPTLTELLPPWVKYPTIPCYSIGWRMGYGENYMLTWMRVIGQHDVNARIEYFRNYLPLPMSWLVWIASYCGHRTNYQNSAENNTTAVMRLEGLGLADFNKFKTWFDDQTKKKPTR